MTSQHSRVDHLRIESVVVDREGDRRPVNDQKVEMLMESIKMSGLLNPITTRRTSLGSPPYLVSGAHRLEACKRLGWDEIPCIVFEFDDAQGELAEIDENLIRNNLTPAEEAIAIARRKELVLLIQRKSGDTNGHHLRRVRRVAVMLVCLERLPPPIAISPRKRIVVIKLALMRNGLRASLNFRGATRI